MITGVYTTDMSMKVFPESFDWARRLPLNVGSIIPSVAVIDEWKPERGRAVAQHLFLLTSAVV